MNAKDLGLVPEQIPAVFEGEYRTVMKKLTASGLPHWGPAQVLQHRNAVVGTKYQDAAWDNYFFTDFGLAATADTIFLAPQSSLLRSLTPKTKLTSYGSLLPEDQRMGIKQYARGDMITGRALTETEARAHLGWLDLCGKSQTLLDKTVENTFRLGKDKYDYNTMMGFYVPSDGEPILRAVVLHRLDGGSVAIGDSDLDYVGARLVGGSSSVVVGSGSAGTAPKNPLEVILDQHRITDTAELNKALELYHAAKKLNL